MMMVIIGWQQTEQFEFNLNIYILTENIAVI